MTYLPSAKVIRKNLTVYGRPVSEVWIWGKMWTTQFRTFAKAQKIALGPSSEAPEEGTYDVSSTADSLSAPMQKRKEVAVPATFGREHLGPWMSFWKQGLARWLRPQQLPSSPRTPSQRA